jgi:hypothetical protein
MAYRIGDLVVRPRIYSFSERLWRLLTFRGCPDVIISVVTYVDPLGNFYMLEPLDR